MLDVKITAYIVPVAEQPQASLTPVISVANIADEGAVITGLIRIYRESTGLMIYSSELAVTQLEHHSTTNIAALTPFDPPSPADDDYFIKADITATSYLPGPPTHDSLGAWYFDIKTPAMGEAPAGHAVTHELGGSDPVDVTGLDGNPDPHAASHADGGSDEISVVALSGLLADEQTPLPHYHEKHLGVFVESDMLGYITQYTTPWNFSSTAGGTTTQLPSLPSHPGIQSIRSSVNANSGMFIRLFDSDSIRIAGSESTDSILRPQTLALTTIRCGFLDTETITDCFDGCYLESVDGTISGKTANNSARSTTGTNYLTVTNTWYRARVAVNADATRVDFYLYAEDGTLLWTDFLTTNIPTTAGRETSHGIVATNSDTTAVTLVDVDYLNLAINRVLVR